MTSSSVKAVAAGRDGERAGAALAAGRAVDAGELARLIGEADCSTAAATVVGYGTMGRQYVKALRALRVGRIRVCSRSPERLDELRGAPGIELASGGVERFSTAAEPGELGIVATPTSLLIRASERLAELGFRRLLIEKPVSLWPAEIDRLAARLAALGVEAACAYNRIGYPSFHEARARVAREGGATSCLYGFTEIIKPELPRVFPAEELVRWGIANSLHVIGMAHGLIGLAREWQGCRTGRLPWHPAGRVFVGSGVSESGVPFAYHADWGAASRWWIEVYTSAAGYRLCPLETLTRKTLPMGEWEPVPLSVFAAEVKAGLVEETAAMLDERVRAAMPLVWLREAAALAAFGEQVFGYESGRAAA